MIHPPSPDGLRSGPALRAARSPVALASAVAVLLLAVAGDLPAEDGLAISAAVRESLASPRIGDRDAAIESLAADPGDEAGALLKALLAGDLYVDRASSDLYLRDAGGIGYALAGTGERGGEGLDLRKVGTASRQRQTLAGFLNARSLMHPDAAVRRESSRALVATGDAEPQIVKGLLELESDPRVRINLERILAARALADPGSSKGEVLAALAFFRARLTPEVQGLVSARAGSGDPETAAAARATLSRMEAAIQHVSLFETFFFGLSLGSVLALMAIGLAVTFGVMGVINMAHGEMVMLGAYTVWAFQELLPGRPGLALLLAVPGSFAVAALAGAAIERAVVSRLYDRPLETLLATFGVSLILQQAVRTFVSPNNRPVATPPFMAGQWSWTEHLSVTWGRFYIILFCLAVFFAILLVMKRSRLGLEVRAVTSNRDVARAMGIDAGRVDLMCFMLGSGVAGMAGAALSQLANVGPNLGQGYIVDSFMVVVFGGVGNLWGTLLGGLIIGMASKFLEPAYGAILAKILIMCGVILFIQRRPRGLFPLKGRAAAG
ncbi:MAG: urea ABC transporter permease subunit UrtB [Deltaproteobacteria bacterium]|jgi:urea transport system permease protein|nr:urea ABC transporter permease subunit UrtB [Deltaproteobacteria bacterium]